MASLTINIPDDLANDLNQLAARQQKSIEEVAVEQLRASVPREQVPRRGTPDALRQMMAAAPPITKEDTDALEEAIASGRLPASTGDIFGE